MITKSLAQILKFKWQSSDRKDIIIVDEKLQAIIEVVVNIPVVIANTQIHIFLQVISFSLKTLLLGTDWLDKYKVDIFNSTQKLQFKY